MKKIVMDFVVVENNHLHSQYSLLKLRPAVGSLPPILPGQFVQVAVANSKTTYLRRPISINNVEPELDLLWLLVRRAGDGTASLIEMQRGDSLNLLLPLGNGFDMTDVAPGSRVLLAGGGVGVAPMLYLGKELLGRGVAPEIIIGARSKDDLLLLDEFDGVGKVHISTDDGSCGEHGVVTTNGVFGEGWDVIYCCGPAPMMKAVSGKARQIGAECFVSLENMMACGLGACLCCVEKTVRGNVCVCTEGPVFNIKELTWQD